MAEKLADLTFELLDRCHDKQQINARTVGLTVAEFKVLRAFHTDSRLAGNVLSERVGLSGGRMTRILDGLVAKAFVQRDIGAKDRRTMEVSLTDEGQRITRELRQSYVETHVDIMEYLPEGAGESVILAMEKLRDAMRSWTT
jgi:DNA-binding MarR family transcriptional regulator